MDADEIMRAAWQAATTDRAATHGEAERNFTRIAALWNAYLGDRRSIEPADVAMMMVLLKVARFRSNPLHQDNFVDIIGYVIALVSMEVPDEAGTEEAL